MKKLTVLALILCILFSVMPAALADQGPDIICDTVRIPALGEKLETPIEIFTFDGFTFSLYGMEKTAIELIIYAHIKNDTSETLQCTIKKQYRSRDGRASNEYGDMPWSERPAAGTEVDTTFALPYPDFASDVNDDMASFSFEVLPYISSAPMCYATVDLRLGETLPCELAFIDQSGISFTYKPTSRAPLFNANGIRIGLMDCYVYKKTGFTLTHSGHDKPLKIAFENLTVNGEPVNETYEFQLEPGAMMDQIELPFAEMTTMTCDFAVYDAGTGDLIFEKTPVILD